MKGKRKSLQKRNRSRKWLIGAAALAAVFLLLPLTILMLTRPWEEDGESGTEISFDDRDSFFDEVTKVEVLMGDEVVEMTLSEYLTGALGGEMPALYPKEALKAQAIAIRTNVMYKKKRRQENPAGASHKNADVCAESSHCMAYVPEEKLREKWGDDYDEYLALIRDAVKESDGVIVTYQGDPISAIFHAVSSGRTERAEDVWGSGAPYLLSVDSPWDKDHARYETRVTLEDEEFKDIFLGKYPDAVFPESAEGWIESVTRSEAGGIKELTVAGVTLSGRAFRSLYGLRSANIAFSFEGGEITMTVHGYGHGVGMSQFGARGMALEGKTAEEIVTWYYTGCETVRLSPPL